MLYRVLRGINEIYPQACLGLFIVLFIVAFVCTMAYPMVPIILVISSVYLVIIARCGYLILRALERKVARRACARGVCPMCDHANAAVVGVQFEGVFSCTGCARVFTAKGDLQLPQETSSAPADGRSDASARTSPTTPVGLA